MVAGDSGASQGVDPGSRRLLVSRPECRAELRRGEVAVRGQVQVAVTAGPGGETPPRWPGRRAGRLRSGLAENAARTNRGSPGSRRAWPSGAGSWATSRPGCRWRPTGSWPRHRPCRGRRRNRCRRPGAATGPVRAARLRRPDPAPRWSRPSPASAAPAPWRSTAPRSGSCSAPSRAGQPAGPVPALRRARPAPT